MEITSRLTADATTATLKDGREVVNFSIAINDRYRPKGQTEVVTKVTYISCSYWNNTTVAGYLKKGSVVELFGKIGLDVWLNMDGQPKGSLNMHVQQLKFFTPSRIEGNNSFNENPAEEEPKENLPF
ncbi:single-stranded DNA-binding protein [Pinibacter soli]|uniref:Single-stranded DNA-binding protein n=1 Tax=Pinibacter soli TaxID=3044211 RepID=A0ABT6R7I5_9BACT|nr:single-stranded DNA-binding protein [Pinibacter soli]MDI3318396.1 single-stranded DNA-binding protein [Pinibacter soli]